MTYNVIIMNIYEDWRDHGHVSKVKDQGECGYANICFNFETMTKINIFLILV